MVKSSVSYSRADERLVEAVLSMFADVLPSGAPRPMWDRDFHAHEPWFAQMQRAINDSDTMVLFWCSHSCRSVAVAQEVAYAQGQGKRIQAVLLDDTALPAALAAETPADLRRFGHKRPNRFQLALIRHAARPSFANRLITWALIALGLSLLCALLAALFA